MCTFVDRKCSGIMGFSLNRAELFLNSVNSANSENLRKSLKLELGIRNLLAVSLWHSGRVSVSHTGDSGFDYSNLFKNNIIFVTEFAEFSEII